MTSPLPFTETKPPWVHWQVSRWSEAAPDWNQLAKAGRVAMRILRGRKCRTTAAFFDEIAAALQFPAYFGENWDALYDCLCDLAWLHCDRVALVIHEADHLLETAPALEWSRFVAVVDQVVKEWNQGKKPRPFHVVLHVEPGKEKTLQERCRTAGLKVQTVPKSRT